ncbi:proline racemase family protein [Aspergillus undulatus]|uniref:proline racemase family protein n=1 Tax=Aspergillus undulatus TaxID=1810928 RepID=UPI003CCE0204
MPIKRTLNVVGAHCAGEVCDVIVGGVLDAPRCNNMYEKMVHFRDNRDEIRQLLLNEPRGRPAMCTNLVLPPCNPAADVGFIIMESEDYPPMSGGNTIATATVLLETGMVKMKDGVTEVRLDTPAGLVRVSAECDVESGKCKSVAFDNVPAFVFKLDFEVDVPGLGGLKVDIAWGGMIYVLVDVAQVGLSIENRHGPRLIEIGERIKRAVQEVYNPVHPGNDAIRGVTILEFTEPMREGPDGDKVAVNTVVVSPGRFDRCPCGTGSCARMAVLHARGQLGVGEVFQHRSIIGSTFDCHIRGTTKVGDYDAVLPTVKGSAWITGYKQMVLDSTDPFPLGFRVGDQWHVSS